MTKISRGAVVGRQQVTSNDLGLYSKAPIENLPAFLIPCEADEMEVLCKTKFVTLTTV